MNLELLPTPVAPLPVVPWADVVERRAAAMAPALRPAFLASGAATDALEALASGEALCVTTGQQPGLFLGPLFTVYKALSAVAFAERLQAVLGRRVVPVFWVAGDDHDHLEASRTYQLSRDGGVEALALPERPPQAPLTPMYREPLGEAVGPLLDTLWLAQPETEFLPEVRRWLGRHYDPRRMVADAFAAAIADLLGDLGLVVFQPTHPAAKSAMGPLLLRALEQAPALDRSLARHAESIRRAGGDPPVGVGDGASLVMLEGREGRDRLMIDDGAFHARRSGERYRHADLAALVESAPDRLSPNVLLRPVVEAALLPTIGYVAGPGELAYLPQCLPVFEALGVAPQVPLPRWSGLVIEARTRKILDKYELVPEDLRLGEGQLEQRLVRGELPEEGRTALEALRAALDRDYGALRDVATAIDPTLRKPVESARNAALAGVRDTEKRILAHLKQRNELLVQQVARARTALFPLGKPQERVLGIPAFLVRYGRPFVGTVLDGIRDWAAALEAPSPHP